MTEQGRSRRRGIVVAIDGPGGAGKSSAARRLARELGYRLLDTGALYRTVALLARRRGVSWDDEAALADIAAGLDVGFRFEGDVNHVLAEGEDVTAAIREPDISGGASQVSALPAVREALLDLQRRLGAEGGVVVEGRDTTTVVFPGAEAKFFITAAPEVRARRRYDELVAGGAPVDFDATLDELARRDERDSRRAVAPLLRAEDAIYMDTGELTLDEVVARMLAVVRERERALGA